MKTEKEFLSFTQSYNFDQKMVKSMLKAIGGVGAIQEYLNQKNFRLTKGIYLNSLNSKPDIDTRSDCFEEPVNFNASVLFDGIDFFSDDNKDDLILILEDIHEGLLESVIANSNGNGLGNLGYKLEHVVNLDTEAFINVFNHHQSTSKAKLLLIKGAYYLLFALYLKFNPKLSFSDFLSDFSGDAAIFGGDVSNCTLNNAVANVTAYKRNKGVGISQINGSFERLIAYYYFDFFFEDDDWQKKVTNIYVSLKPEVNCLSFLPSIQINLKELKSIIASEKSTVNAYIEAPKYKSGNSFTMLNIAAHESSVMAIKTDVKDTLNVNVSDSAVLTLSGKVYSIQALVNDKSVFVATDINEDMLGSIFTAKQATVLYKSKTGINSSSTIDMNNGARANNVIEPYFNDLEY